MLFNPDIEKILKRTRIEKPQEEFILANPPAQLQKEISQEDLLKSIEQKPLELIDKLNEEAANVQELIDILVETAEDITIEIPEEDQQLIGEKINTQDYLVALDNIEKGENEHIARRTVEHFEWGVLQDTNTENTNWTLLALTDFRQLRKELVSAVGILEGSLLENTQLTTGGVTWTGDAVFSHLNKVHKGLIQSSVDFRFKFFNSTRSINIDLKSALFEGLIKPITRAEEARIRRVLNDLDEALDNIKNVLKTAHLVRNLEFVQVRDALTALVTRELVKHLVSTLTALLSRFVRRVVDPVLDLFTKGFEDSGPLGLIGDQISNQIGFIIADSIDVLLDQYNGLAAELLRELDKESQSRLLKLQVLGERSVISRYIAHIDKARALIDRALKELNLSKEVMDRLFGNITAKQAPPETKVMKRLKEREDYQANSADTFTVRTSDVNQPQNKIFEPGEIPSVEEIEPVEPGRDDGHEEEELLDA